MTTVQELIDYLEKLPKDTVVKVPVTVQKGYDQFSKFVDLDVPYKNITVCTDSCYYNDIGEVHELELGDC